MLEKNVKALKRKNNMAKTTAQTNKELINKLDKEIALIKKDISVIKENHLYHIEKSIKSIQTIMWTVGFAVFTNLILLVRNLLF
tara:strand:+ start:984 stop:1235 length:252 start_codon:yes stop_codon:yes gene_type:complete